MIVPRRVLALENPNLPKDAPIIGLGCSSFSHFFWSEDELAMAGGVRQWTPETIDRHHPHVQEWIRTIHHAIQECGISLLDTAPWYGHGTSEVVLGWALEELLSNQTANRDSLTINTKVGRYEADLSRQFDFTFETTMKSVERSLKRMKCMYIDVLQLHDPEFAPTLEVLLDETIPAMIECRNKGWCKALGITGYPLEVQHQILLETVKKYGEPVFDQSLTYCHYNLHDSSLVTRPVSEKGKSFADFVTELQLALLAAAPLSMGLLTHNTPPDWHPASVALKEACHEAASYCERQGINISSLAIVVALANPRISCTLLGMKNVEQVKFAAEIASRFANVPQTETDPRTILRQVLSDMEYAVWLHLNDATNSPFATVWKDGSFRWDGASSGFSFWMEIEGAKATNWQRPLA
ncbi:Aldo/keto reductase-like protein [Fragilaria crotonensis]|nr:Aldo/keto reductase-like protein [Fragilaria crotonensis]